MESENIKESKLKTTIKTGKNLDKFEIFLFSILASNYLHCSLFFFRIYYIVSYILQLILEKPESKNILINASWPLSKIVYIIHSFHKIF